MKSQKKVKPLNEIIKPYSITPPVEIFIGVNGSSRTLPRGVKSQLTESEFQALITSDYSKYL